MKRLTCGCRVLLVLCIWLASVSLCFSSGSVDHSLYGDLLGSYVHDGVVDYIGFKKDENRLDTYLNLLDRTSPETLSRDERLAFYINAYNAYTIKLILDNFKNGKPPSSIKKIGGFFTKPWSIKFCRVGGKLYTLDNLEHDIIRPLFKEPRVHFAVNCASKSCPPLLSVPYLGATLETQLQSNAIAFINDPKHNMIKGETLYVSKIFKWFANDFNDDVLGFFSNYARGDTVKKLQGMKRLNVSYLDYDWSLNDGGKND